MTSSEKEKLQRELKNQGYQYKESDDSFNKSNSRVKFDGNNGFNDSGYTYRTYRTCIDHLDKKRK